MKVHPPKRALAFLRWFCRDDYIEEVEGDLTEIFKKRFQQSPATARNVFVLDVLRYFRPEFIKPFVRPTQIHPAAMFRHNLLITYRTFLKYRSSFFINLFGLSTGLTCVLLIYLWTNDELKIDQFHENSSRLYQVLENVNQDDRIITRFTTAGPTAEALAEEMPEVEYAATATTEFGGTYILSVDNRDFTTRGLYATHDFFKLFSFRLIQGDADQVLSDKKSMVISMGLASRLFGSPENAVGKVVEWQHEKEYKVSGVFEDIPPYSSMQFDFVLSFEDFRDGNEWVKSWFNTAPQTYLLMKNGTDIDAFNRKIADYIRLKTEGKASHRTPFATLYSKNYLYNRYENGIQNGGRIQYVRLFSVIAVFILIIACINFMNLSTARASRRLKEVGMKKAIGARRGTLVIQYLGESTLMALLSFLIAMIVGFVLLPQFNLVTGKHLTFSFDETFIPVVAGMVIMTGVISGSYPAFYLSGFNTSVILRGKIKSLAGELWARKGLVVFQFAISVILMVCVWVVYRQIEYVQTQNLGYQKDNVLLFPRKGQLWDSLKFETFLSQIRSIPGIANASSSEHDMTGHNGGTYGVVWPGKDPEDRTEFERVAVDYGLIETMGMAMKQGRSFSPEYGSENTKIIFNEAGIKFMGIADPIGKTVKLWGEDKEIIGIVKDFHFESFHERVKPLFLRYDPGSTRNIMAKIKAGEQREAVGRLKELYNEFVPGFPLEYRFLDEDYNSLYAAERRVATLSNYFAGLAILISCLGLFGLAAFTAERRIKEIGIRKILGSSELGIFYLLSGDFTRMVLVAILIALPISYYVAAKWLDSFAFKTDLVWWLFAGSGFVALLIALLTVAIQTAKAMRINPAECLRSD